MKKSTIAIIILLVVSAAAGLMLFQVQKREEPQTTAAAVEPTANPTPAMAEAQGWGVILQDNVFFAPDEQSVAKPSSQNQRMLNTGDTFTKSVPSPQNPNVWKIQLTSGDEGWIDSKNAIDLSKMTEYGSYVNSTSPIERLFAADSVKNGDPKYKILISKEFLERAAKNPDQIVRERAQAIQETERAEAAQGAPSGESNP